MMPEPAPASVRAPTRAQATRAFARIALLSFGGPAGQIAVMHRILVEEQRWISDARFLHALNYCMLLPGPEAMQLVTYIGWLLHGIRGGVIAGVLFVLPGLISIMGLSVVYALYGDLPLVAALFFGLKAAVLAIVLQALVKIAGRALTNNAMRVIALASFAAIFAFDVPFPLIVAGAGVCGLVGARLWPGVFAQGVAGGAVGTGAQAVLGDDASGLPLVTRRRALMAGIGALLLWLLPVAALWLALGPGQVFTDIATFFSRMALVTFGGAYAALAYVAQEAVGTYHWLGAPEMLNGLGMAETTPGPLIMVLQFVGFLAAFRDAGGMPPLLAGALGGLLASWVTFLPCFAWIFLGAPWIEALRSSRALANALAAVTAAVVGVILNLAIWFALHVIWADVRRVEAGPLRLDLPVPDSLDPAAAALSVVALMAVFRWRLGIGPVLLGSALAGLALHLAGLTRI